MRPILRSIFILGLILKGSFILAQARFVATVSPGTIGKNEYAQLDLTVVNAASIPRIIPSSLRNFIIVSGPNSTTSISSVNNQTSASYTYSFILRPRKAGKFMISPAAAMVDGKQIFSNPVVLKVTNSTKSSGGFTSPYSLMDPFPEIQPETQYHDFILKAGEDVGDKIKKNMFLRTEVNKTSCYAGEPVVATYKLYSRFNSEASITQNPSFNGIFGGRHSATGH
jgi:hypothetical protein